MTVCPVSPQPAAPQFASQERVYQDIGVEMLDHAFEGTYRDGVNVPSLMMVMVVMVVVTVVLLP